jgi:hypothetical protein
MKKIGETSGGTTIVEMNKADWAFLGRIAEVCAGVGAAPVDSTVLPPDAVRLQTVAVAQPAKPKATKKAKPVPAAKPSGKTKACVICGKAFTPKTSEKTCGPKCWAERNTQCKRASKEKAEGKPAAPALTKEERKKMLMESAARMGLREPDPAQVIGETAKRERFACGEE